MHYSIIIQGQAPNGYFTWQQGNYRFKNPYITMMKILFTPDSTTTAAFTNVDTKNTVTNGKGEKVEFDKGYYTLAEILAMLNEMTACGFSIITSTNSFGCIHITTSTTIDFSNAPDIREILGITETNLPAAIYDGKNIIDITRNRQVIQVFSSIIRTSDLKIADQNNNLLTTMMIDDPQANYFRKIEDICIPICNRFDKLYFTFKDLDGNLMNLTGVFELQLTIDDVVDKDDKSNSISSFSQFSLSQVCNTPKTVVKLENPLSFKQCYISSISLYTDFKLFNVDSDQLIKVYGDKTNTELTAEIEIPRGQYTIEELLALLNCSDSLFELIYYGENAFRVTISDFNYIDFSQARTIMTILGISDTKITEAEGQEIRFPLTSECNKISVTNKVKNFTKTFELSTGLYTWSEFVDMLKRTLEDFVGTITLNEYDDYIEFIAEDDFYFNRVETESLNTIQKYYWLKWYTLVQNIQSNLLEKPDLNILDPSFNTNDAFWVEDDLCFCIYPDYTLTMDHEFAFFNMNVKVNINSTEKTFTHSICESTLQKFCDAFKSWLDTNYTGLVTLTYDDNGNPVFKSTNTTFTATWNNFNVPVERLATSSYVQYTIKMSSTNVKDVNVYSHDFLCDEVFDITVQNKTTLQKVETTYTVPAGHYSSQALCALIANFINETAKTVGVNNAGVQVYGGPSRYAVYGGNNITWTLQAQHSKDYYIMNPNTTTYYTYDQPHLPRYYMRLNKELKPMRKWDVNVSVNPSETTTVMQGNGLLNKVLCGICNLTKKFNPSSSGIIGYSYWDDRFLYSGNSKCSCCFTQYTTEIEPSIRNKIITYTTPIGNRSYIILRQDGFTCTLPAHTFIYTNAAGTAKTLNISQRGRTTQQNTIEYMNKLFESNGLDIQWTVAEEGYKLLTLGGTYSGTFFNLNVLGIRNIDVKANYILWPYNIPNSTVSCRVARGHYMSESPCDITNNLSNLKLYCNIVKSKTKPLLSNIPIDDLNKNYFYKNRLLIPCLEFLDRLEYEFRDENDKELSFLGTIYLLLTFTTQSK